MLSLLIIVVPIMVLLLKTGSKHGWRWRIFGAVVGLTIVPISDGISAAAYHIPILSIGLMMDIIGMTLAVFHETPGYQLGVSLGLFSGNEVISHGMPYYYLLLLNTIFWMVTYGAIGRFLDVNRSGNKSMAIPA